MKWTIKYEDHKGDCHVKTVFANSEQHAASQVFAKEIYWIKKATTCQ